MKKSTGIIVPVILLCVLSACQTAKPVSTPKPGQEAPWHAVAPGQSLIQTEVLGFSPLAENGKTTIDFALLFANEDSVKSWKVVLANKNGIQRTYSGSGSNLPSSITWDGQKATGVPAPEGTYTATLSVNYGKAFSSSTSKSTSFILDTTRPTGKINVTPSLFSPLEPTDSVTIMIEGATAIARIESWSMDIFDPGWNLFKSFGGKWPNNSVVWDGKGVKGDIVVSAEDYPVIVKFRDEFGNVGFVQSTIPIDILVIKQGDGYRIENSRVYFKDFTADYRSVAPELSKQNTSRLDQLAEKLKKYPEHKIKIVGHAVMIHWDDKALAKIEQDTVLVPLSKARAGAIKQAMVERGVNVALIETEGVGAADQLVPDSDYANRWQNRRTAIFLTK